MNKKSIKRKILALFSAVMLLFCGCNNSNAEQVTQYVEKLIENYNQENARFGYTLRDYTYPSPGLAWKHYYCVMDENYRLDEEENGVYSMHTTFIEYVSISSAPSPKDAQKLGQYEVFDSFQAVTRLINQNGGWSVEGASDVFSQKSQKWNRMNLFQIEIINDMSFS